MKTRNGMIFIIAVFIVFAFSGCAKFSAFMDSYSKSKGVVMSLIAHYVEADNTGKRARAANRIATEALNFIDAGDIVSFADLKTFLISKIKWDKMLPEDKVALEELFNAVTDEEATAWLTPEEQVDMMKQKVRVQEFALWLQTMSLRYVNPR
jgi:hypothetical protein